MREADLRGRKVLVVEDDYFLAEDMRADFERAGAEVIGPLARIRDAIAALEQGPVPDLAVLDVSLGGEMVFPLADLLRARGIPFVFATGYDATMIPEAFAGVTRCEKPVEPVKVAAALLKSR